MKTLYQGVAEILTKDTDLRGFVGYTEAKKNIRRAYLPEGVWDKLIIFYLQPEFVKTDFTPQIRDVPLIVRVYDRDDDLNCDTIGERVILLLDGADLSVAGKVHCYGCYYEGELSASMWNAELKSYEKILRFMISFRVDEVVGTSGKPTKKRQNNRY